MNSKLIKFLIIRFFSSLGDQLLLFAVPLLVYAATHSVAMSGLAFFIEWMPRVVSLPFAGVFSDKFGGRKVYLIADSVRALMCIVGFCFVSLFPHYTFYVVSILMGMCAFFYAQAFIAQETTIPRLVSVDNLHKAQSMIQTVEQAAMILGPFLGSVLVYFLPMSYLLVFASLVFSIGFIGMFALKGFSSHVTVNTSKKHILRDIYEGLLILSESKRLIWLCVITVVVNLIWGLVLATSAAIVTGAFNKNAATYGYMQTMTGVLSVVVLLLAPNIITKLSLKMVGIISYVLIVFGAFFIGSNISFCTFVLGYLLVITMDGVFNIYIRTERVKIIPKEHMGKTIGLIVLINQLSLPVAGLIVAKYSATLGVEKLFLSMGVLASVFLLFQLVELITRRNMEEEYGVK